MPDIVELSQEAWYAEGTRLFGADRMKWRFVCPVCSHAQSVEDYKNAGATEGMVAFSCVGRATGAGSFNEEHGGPCNYAGGGLFRLNPVTLVLPDGERIKVFEFESERGMSIPGVPLGSKAARLAWESSIRLAGETGGLK